MVNLITVETSHAFENFKIKNILDELVQKTHCQLSIVLDEAFYASLLRTRFGIMNMSRTAWVLTARQSIIIYTIPWAIVHLNNGEKNDRVNVKMMEKPVRFNYLFDMYSLEKMRRLTSDFEWNSKPLRHIHLHSDSILIPWKWSEIAIYEKSVARFIFYSCKEPISPFWTAWKVDKTAIVENRFAREKERINAPFCIAKSFSAQLGLISSTKRWKYGWSLEWQPCRRRIAWTRPATDVVRQFWKNKFHLFLTDDKEKDDFTHAVWMRIYQKYDQPF